MYQFLYALRSIPRNRGRYLLFGGILVLLITVCFVNLTLGVASDRLCEAIKTEYGGRMILNCYAHTADLVSIDEYAIFHNPDLVEEMEIRSASCYFEPTVTSARTDQTYIYNQGDKTGHYLWFVGLNMDYPNPFNRVNIGAVLREGQVFNAADECVITDTMFDAWKEIGLVEQVGDTVTLQITNKLRSSTGYVLRDENKKELTVSADVSLKIVGVVEEDTLELRYQNQYQNKSVLFLPADAAIELMRQLEARTKAVSSIWDNPQTDLYTGYEVIYRLYDYHDAEQFMAHVRTIQDGFADKIMQLQINGTLYRHYGYDKTHPEKYAQFDKEIEFYKKMTERQFYAERLMPDFEQVIIPLEQSQSMTAVITAMIAMLAVMTVALMSVINMRERKYELGVLRCVGKSKSRISLTLGIESMAFLLITAALGIVLGFGFAALFGDAFVDLTIVDTTIDTMAISGAVALRLVIAALGLSVFATVISAAFVMRARPLAILRNRT